MTQQLAKSRSTAGESQARIGRGRLADLAYEHVKNRLLDGAFGLGDKISVDGLVSELSTSRQPVMDALKRLASEGFLEIIPQVGCRVVIPAEHEIIDFFRLFATAEGFCAELAAQRGTESEFAELRAVSARIGAISGTFPIEDDRAREYRRLNREFHGRVHDMSHSSLVGGLASSLWDRSDFFISTAIGTRLFADRLEDAHREHEGVVAALARRDGATASTLMAAHCMAFGNRIGGTMHLKAQR